MEMTTNIRVRIHRCILGSRGNVGVLVLGDEGADSPCGQRLTGFKRGGDSATGRPSAREETLVVLARLCSQARWPEEIIIWRQSRRRAVCHDGLVSEENSK